METQFNNQSKVIENISSIFGNKGIFGAVAEKAFNNYKSKANPNVSKDNSHLHYFAVGHAFKNINTKKLFDYQYSDNEKDMFPTKYLALQSNNFDFDSMQLDETAQGVNKSKNTNQLKNLISNIRNINAHFIHTLDDLRIDNIDSRILTFIKQSFEVALIQGVYSKKSMKLKKDEGKHFLNNAQKEEVLVSILNNLENELTQFMKEIFYQTLFTISPEKWKKNSKDRNLQKKSFLESHLRTKEDWINWILFNENEEDLIWQLNQHGDGSLNNHVHDVLKISKGRYLSFEGSLFLLSMFLYANEANYLIPKLKGYKKTDEDNKTKLEVFRFFSKKFKSQDVDSEHNDLVKFRDMVQYLAKFPIKWNAELHKDEHHVVELKRQIILIELRRFFGEDLEEIWSVYLMKTLWGEIYLTKPEREIFAAISEQEKRRIEDTINANPVYEDNKRKIAEIKRKNTKSHIIRKLEQQNSIIERNSQTKINPNFEKFKNRIASNLLFQSNGRNNDRFMDFSMRYLAECNYFGSDTKFKMYEFYFTDEEQDGLTEKKINLDKKAFEKIHFHDGKQTYFNTYTDHKERYPNWDTPFVVQNNAVYIQLKLGNTTKTICLQRELLSYLLEHALSCRKPINAGLELLEKYIELKKSAYLKGKNKLETQDSITKEEKTELKKLFPKRVLHHYYKEENNIGNTANAFRNYLEKAELLEDQYNDKRKKAEQEGRLDLFEKKNKGKQFKLRFIYQACKLMYFREQYEIQKEIQREIEGDIKVEKGKEYQIGHHQRFNITREEFNDFSRWMFAFGEVKEYEQKLSNLFESKQYLSNVEFKLAFEKSGSLDDFYLQIKENYRQWLEQNMPNSKENRFRWSENYANWMENGVVFINAKHFIDFAIENKIINKVNNKLFRPILKNKKHLYSEYYAISPNQNSGEKNNLTRKLYFNLQKNQTEDCLLYEIALNYLNHNQKLRENYEKHLSVLLTQDVKIKIEDANYFVEVPFKDLEKFAQIQYFDRAKKEYGILKNLPIYLRNLTNGHEKVMSITEMKNYFDSNQGISLAHLSHLNNHLITQQGRFTNCIMAMEEYYIWKHEILLENSKTKEKNRLDLLRDITDLQDYFDYSDKTRNTAFHMNLPLDKTYKSSFLEKEKMFVEKEKVRDYKDLSSCPYMLRKTLEVFMNQMHDEIKMDVRKNDSDDMKKQKRKNMENEFFEKITRN